MCHLCRLLVLLTYDGLPATTAVSMDTLQRVHMGRIWLSARRVPCSSWGVHWTLKIKTWVYTEHFKTWITPVSGEFFFSRKYWNRTRTYVTPCKHYINIFFAHECEKTHVHGSIFFPPSRKCHIIIVFFFFLHVKTFLELSWGDPVWLDILSGRSPIFFSIALKICQVLWRTTVKW